MPSTLHRLAGPAVAAAALVVAGIVVLPAGAAERAPAAAAPSPLPTPPPAGSVTLIGSTLTYTAGASTRNRITADGTADFYAAVVDEATAITIASAPAGRCFKNHSRHVRCTGVKKIRVFLGDGDDTLWTGNAVPVEASGGPGHDRLDGEHSHAAVHLRGDTGDDVLLGGRATDQLSGGAGDDMLRAGGATVPNVTPQRIDGGPGADRCSGEFSIRVDCEQF
ncbi:hypothetical protein [Spirilliplanes yamanashiensis]|uniref:Uncharacterized protein n=1 Tax=Spirilliplanes yamanashiensis TaxID=42233 RepID=A0A8J4DKD4_9ACTN|nr:hypothetical protein [Spirilliplanes yamanashiensis]MDP9815927.1 Ca2+-binding RTX toxin-like protein [Spirilliplanes yamanashiensis]GIJ04183.1 hypothetical protein Sya03_35350 [Spirilliplanes yamanashiensis]